MLKENVKSFLKYASVALLSAAIACKSAGSIGYAANTARFYNSVSEHGFISKEQAFGLKINHRFNSSNNLETYLEINDASYPVYARPDGIIVGDAFHNWCNFTPEEKQKVVTTEIYNSNDRLISLISSDSYAYIFSRLPNDSKKEVVSSIVSSTSKGDLLEIFSSVDYETLWQSIPNAQKKQMIMKNLRDSTRRSMHDVRDLFMNFWGNYNVF